MNSRKISEQKTSYDVAPAHDADSVQTAPPHVSAKAAVSAAAVEEIQANSSFAVRASELRGEEFDFDLTKPAIEPESLAKPKPKYGWAWLLLALATTFCVYTFGAVNGEKSRRPLPVGPFSAPSGKPMTVKVQVAGEVNKPGVYELPFNARVQDAVRLAGGFRPLADKSTMNLADWAQDGSKIEVATRATPAPNPTPTIIIKEVTVAAAPGANAGVSAPSSGASSSNSGAAMPSGIPLAKTESGATSSNASTEYLRANPVDLNKASQAQLEVLPGVGPKMAERILAYRTENGGFKSIDQLDDVKGIGEKRMATLKPLVKVR